MYRFALVGLLVVFGAGTANAQDSTYAAQDSPGQVSLRALPTWSDTALVIEVSANTHSVDLGGIDLRKQARLRVGEGALEPATAGVLSGHHGRARLVFPMSLRPVRFTLEIRDVPDVPVRTLTWPPERPAP